MTTTRFFVLTLVLFASLTCAMTYPQVLHLRDAVHDEGDPLLNAWALAWVAHQLPRAPAHLFDANIFYPERRTLAFSETLLLPALVAAPLRWLGAGPLLVYNIVLLSGFTLSGAGVALLVRTLTGRPGPALLAGIVFAFLPFRIDHYAHVQLQQTECLPFAMWAFHRLLGSGRRRDGVLFGAFTAGQMLSCMYYGLLLIPYLAVVCGTMVLMHLGGSKRTRPAADGIGAGRIRTAAGAGRVRSVASLGGRVRSGAGAAGRVLSDPAVIALAVAGAVVLVAALPVGTAYLGARKVVGERGRDEVAQGSATLINYLGPPPENALYGRAFAPFAAAERRLFPGLVAVALALVALWPRKRGDTKRKRLTFVLSGFRGCELAYALGLIVAFDLSLGFNGFTYRVLYDHVLPFRGLRIPARTGMIVGFSLAVLAGYGAARLVEPLRSAARRRSVLVAIGALMIAEYASRPIALVKVPLVAPAAYADLVRDKGDSPTAAIFELPVSSRDDPTYMYYSTFHWQHLVNGYSGFFPPSYVFLVNAVGNIPDDASIHAIKSHGTRYLLVHGERLYGSRYDELTAALNGRRELTRVSRTPSEREGQHGEISVYRVSYAEAR